jgi:uncharacterized protein
MAIAAAAAAALMLTTPATEPGRATVSFNQICAFGLCIGGSTVNAEAAYDDASRSKGLMLRESMPPDEGMLFIYDGDVHRRFWMKNTTIPLDMIWVDSNYTVVHIEHASPCQTEACRIYESPKAAKYMLETNRGYAASHGISVGDKATIRPPR